MKQLSASEVLAKAKPGDALAWPPEHKSKALIIGQDFAGSGGAESHASSRRRQRTGLFLEDQYGNSYTVRFSDTRPSGGGHAEGMSHVPASQSRPGTKYLAITSTSNHGTYPLFKKTAQWYPSAGRVKRPLEGGSEHYRYRKGEERRSVDPEFSF